MNLEGMPLNSYIREKCTNLIHSTNRTIRTILKFRTIMRKV